MNFWVDEGDKFQIHALPILEEITSVLSMTFIEASEFPLTDK